MMLNPEKLQLEATHIVLLAIVATYLSPVGEAEQIRKLEEFAARFQTQALKLREGSILLKAAIEKMRIANERLAARMAEHKAFFAKYESPDAG